MPLCGSQSARKFLIQLGGIKHVLNGPLSCGSERCIMYQLTICSELTPLVSRQRLLDSLRPPCCTLWQLLMPFS